MNDVECQARYPARLRQAVPVGPVVLGLLLVAGLPTAGPGRLQAQDQVRNFTEPILTHASDGHHAPVRDLLFASPDGAQLLSGGEDKVIHLWNPGSGPPAPLRTLRPPIWRGLRGAIYGMALSPMGDAQGQRTLAVAGYGVDAAAGSISLYRFPGLDLGAKETGELVGQLKSGSDRGPVTGHSGPVFRLRFDPSGARLASSGGDANVLIWDVSERRVVVVLGGHAPPVKGLAYLPGGRRLVTGDRLGMVRVWDTSLPARPLLSVQTIPQPATGHAINDLAASRDWIVVGREDGALIRLDALTLRQSVRLPTLPTQAGIRALAISHDSTRLAIGIDARRLATLAERPRLACDVELRSFPDGRVLLPPLAQLDGSVDCLAFSGDDRWLAYAGDNRQTIRVQDLRERSVAPYSMLGHGAGIRDVGFRRDGRAIGFSRREADPENRVYEGFDFGERGLTTVALDQLVRAVSTLDGWTVRPSTPHALEVAHVGGQSVQLALDPNLDGRWWSYSLLRSGMAGGRPLVAVGCAAGVSIHSLDLGGQRTRLLAGHEGPVNALAVAPDGQWLATGSSDQTVRLWTIAIAGTVAPLGARFHRDASGAQVVDAVAPRSFAEAMGLRTNDVLEITAIGKRQVDPGEFVARADGVTPGIELAIQVRPRKDAADNKPIQMATTKRDGPALSLFPAVQPEGEWVLWMPQGFYDTSIDGDGKFLGWHLNAAALDQPRPTRYYPIKQFQDRFYRKDVVKKLLDTADLDAALTLAAAPTPAEAIAGARPPALGVEIVESQGDSAKIRILAEAAPGKDIKETRIMNGARLVQTIDHPPGTTRFEQVVAVHLESGRNRWNIKALDRERESQTRWVELDYQGPPDHPPRLLILTFGAERFEVAGAGPIVHAERDASDLAGFFAARLVAPGSGTRFDRDRIEVLALAGADARVEPALERITAIRDQCAHARLGRDDLVVVVVESHLVGQSGRAFLLGADSRDGKPPAPAIAADELGAALGEVAASGCKVIMLLDVVHRVPAADEADALKAWIRDLRDRHSIITLLASRTRPSEPTLVDGRPTFPRFRHRIFAQGVLDSTDPRRHARIRMSAQGCFSLFGFQDAVQDIVRELTHGDLDTACYIPELIPARFPLLDAQPH